MKSPGIFLVATTKISKAVVIMPRCVTHTNTHTHILSNEVNFHSFTSLLFHFFGNHVDRDILKGKIINILIRTKITLFIFSLSLPKCM